MGPFPLAIGVLATFIAGATRGTTCTKCSLWGLSPRPMAHKTIALTTELRELMPPIQRWADKKTLARHYKQPGRKQAINKNTLFEDVGCQEMLQKTCQDNGKHMFFSQKLARCGAAGPPRRTSDTGHQTTTKNNHPSEIRVASEVCPNIFPKHPQQQGFCFKMCRAAAPQAHRHERATFFRISCFSPEVLIIFWTTEGRGFKNSRTGDCEGPSSWWVLPGAPCSKTPKLTWPVVLGGGIQKPKKIENLLWRSPVALGGGIQTPKKTQKPKKQKKTNKNCIKQKKHGEVSRTPPGTQDSPE